jgi:hypothetical protein
MGLASTGVALKATASLNGQPFSIGKRGRAVVFTVGSRALWIIDPQKFDGTASIGLHTDEDRILLSLKEAYYPGTRFPAGFESTLERSGDSWSIKFAMDSGAEINSDLLPFLLGQQPAKGRWQLRGISPFDGFAIRSKETAEIAYRPDWSIELRGDISAVLKGFELPLRSGSVRVAMNEGESLCGTETRGRTAFHFRRDGARWNIDIGTKSQFGWALSHDDEIFDSLQVEGSNGPHGFLRTALLSQRETSGAALRINPGGGWIGDSGEPFEFELQNPRFALALEDGSSKSGLIAEIGKKAVWAHADGISLLLAGGEASGFELIADAGQDCAPKLVPEMLTASFQSDDEAQLQLNFKEKRQLPFTWADFVQPIEDFLGHVHVLPGEHSMAFDLTCGDKLHVLRPKDLLNLTFEFESLRLHTGLNPRIERYRNPGNQTPTNPDVGDEGCPPAHPQRPHLRCAANGGPAKVTVGFPPQHIAEAAIYDKLSSLLTPQVNLPDTDLAPILGLPSSTVLTQPQRVRAMKLLDPDFPTPPNESLSIPLPARMAGESRLVFTLPEKHKPIPFKVESLLDWSNWTPYLAPVARHQPNDADSPSPTDPAGTTAIELPWRLMISPGIEGRWKHAKDLQDWKTGVYEIWHTRLGKRAFDSKKKPLVQENSTDRSIRAIWSPDFIGLGGTFNQHDHFPFRASLDRADRNEIVHLTSNFNITDIANKKFTPAAVPVDQLILSPMGGWLKSFGVWNPPKTAGNTFTVEQWKHSATMARDHYVRVVYKGYLLPFGHRASLVKVTDRRFDSFNGKTYAYLHQRMFVVVQKPRKEFPVLGQENGGRQFPFKRVDALTLVTPTIDVSPPFNQSLFWVSTDFSKGPFPMRFRFFDCDGGTSEADVNVVFADATVATDTVLSGMAKDLFNSGQAPGHPFPMDAAVTQFNGQKIALACSSKPGNTGYEVKDIRWNAKNIAGLEADLYEADLPSFFPLVDYTDISSTSIRRIAPQTAPVKVRYYKEYLRSAFDPKVNRGEVFLEIDANASLTLPFSTNGAGDKAGALATPDTATVGFARTGGPVGGTPKPGGVPSSASLDTWASGVFDAVNFFGGLTSAKILGGLKLSDIIAAIAPGVASNLEKAPQMLEQSIFGDVDPSSLVPTEEKIVAIIDGTVLAPFNAKLAGQKASVDSNMASVEGDKGNVLKHAALIGAIVQYAEALKTLVENPNELVDAIWQSVLPAITAYEQQLLNAFTALATNFAMSAVASASNALNSVFSQANLPVIKANLPDLATYSDLLPLAADLAQRIPIFANAIKPPIKPTAIPSLFQQFAAILDDLLQILERTGYLTADPLTSLSSLVETGENSLYSFWATFITQNTGAVQQSLSDLEESVMRLAAATASSADAQTALQALRQIQSSAAWLIDAGKTNWQGKPYSAVLLSQILQVQGQLLSAVQALQAVPTFATATLVVQSNGIANAATFAQRFIDSTVESTYAQAVTTTLDSLNNRLTTLQTNLTTLRGQIAGAAGNPAGQMTLKIQHFTLSLQYRGPLAIVPEIVHLNGQPALAATIASALKTLKDLNDQTRALASQVTTLVGQLQTAFTTLNTNITGDLSRLLDGFLQPLNTALSLAATFTADVLRKGQQVLQTIVNLQTQLEQGLTTAATDLANAQAILDQIATQIPLPTSATLSYDFHPTIKNVEPVFTVDPDADFTIHAQVTVPLLPTGSAQPTYNISASLTNFQIHLIGQPDFITIEFNGLTFTSNSGSSPNCRVNIKGVTFGEDLSFVSALQSLLDPAEGPFLEFPAGMIRTGFRFQVPETIVGAFNLMQLALSIAVSLPYNGDPARCDFAISSMDSPFLLSTGIYGGGGFLHLLLGLDGVELLEGALEFGVVADISIGPVSGGGYVMAGIYFNIEANEATVCGFVHAHGHVNLFDIAQLDVDVYVSICFSCGSVVGTATITVHVEILFFSADFQLTASYTFAGSGKGCGQGDAAAAFAEEGSGPAAGLVASDVAEPAEAEASGQDFCDIDPDKWREYFESFAT